MDLYNKLRKYAFYKKYIEKYGTNKKYSLKDLLRILKDYVYVCGEVRGEIRVYVSSGYYIVEANSIRFYVYGKTPFAPEDSEFSFVEKDIRFNSPRISDRGILLNKEQINRFVDKVFPFLEEEIFNTKIKNLSKINLKLDLIDEKINDINFGPRLN